MIVNKNKQEVEDWFLTLRNNICESFEEIEKEFQHKTIKKKPGKFNKKRWKRLKNNKGGGGEMSIMKGRIFEKVGVNVSTVYGNFSKEFRKQIPGCEKSPKFWATGISLVAHLHSPFITAAHFNTRHIITSKSHRPIDHNIFPFRVIIYFLFPHPYMTTLYALFSFLEMDMLQSYNLNLKLYYKIPLYISTLHIYFHKNSLMYLKSPTYIIY